MDKDQMLALTEKLARLAEEFVSADGPWGEKRNFILGIAIASHSDDSLSEFLSWFEEAPL